MTEISRSDSYWQEAQEAVGLLLDEPEITNPYTMLLTRRCVDTTMWPGMAENWQTVLTAETSAIKLLGITTVKYSLTLVETVRELELQRRLDLDLARRRLNLIDRRLKTVDHESIDCCLEMSRQDIRAEHRFELSVPGDEEYELLLDELRQGVAYWH
jgi:hypothetical protein